MDLSVESVVLAVDTFVFAMCFYAYYKSKMIISQIEDAPQLDISNDLRDMVSIHPGHRIPYASIHGTVTPIGRPLVSSDGTVIGVVHCIMHTEHIAQLTEGHWTDRQRIISNMRNVTPFSLTSEHNHVRVLNPLSATILDMDVISDLYKGSEQEVISHVWSHILGVKQTGIQKQEKMLRIGTNLTALGELTLSHDKKTVILQQPSNGAPYFLTVMEISSLLGKLKRNKLAYGVICLVCFALGIAICIRFQRKKKTRFNVKD